MKKRVRRTPPYSAADRLGSARSSASPSLFSDTVGLDSRIRADFSKVVRRNPPYYAGVRRGHRRTFIPPVCLVKVKIPPNSAGLHRTLPDFLSFL